MRRILKTVPGLLDAKGVLVDPDGVGSFAEIEALDPGTRSCRPSESRKHVFSQRRPVTDAEKSETVEAAKKALA